MVAIVIEEGRAKILLHYCPENLFWMEQALYFFFYLTMILGVMVGVSLDLTESRIAWGQVS